MENTCGNCAHFGAVKDGNAKATTPGGGVCRFNPPVPMPIMFQVPPSPGNPDGGTELQIRGFFPPVQPDTPACGQHLPLTAPH